MLSNDCHLEKDIKDWLGYLKEKENKLLMDNLRKNSMTGRPCGDESFMDKMEDIMGRRLRALPWGRPRKDK